MAKELPLERTVTRSATDSFESMFKKTRVRETIIQAALFLSAAISILTTIGIVYVLGREAWLFFGSEAVSIVEYLTTAVWQPQLGTFGVWALLGATIITSLIAMVVAIPIGLSAAIYLSEYASPTVRQTLKPILEILAGVPTVVYGYFALTFMTPLLRTIFGQSTVEIYNMASAGIVMGIMIIPLVSSLSEDALSAVPKSLREASYGLGATKFETSTQIVVPGALSGIAAAVILAISRAIGETMIVALAAGAGPANDLFVNWDINRILQVPLTAGETMTGHIVRISSGDLSYNTIDYNSIFALGLTLFLMTLVLNLISNYIVARFREVYD